MHIAFPGHMFAMENGIVQKDMIKFRICVTKYATICFNVREQLIHVFI